MPKLPMPKCDRCGAKRSPWTALVKLYSPMAGEKCWEVSGLCSKCAKWLSKEVKGMNGKRTGGAFCG